MYTTLLLMDIEVHPTMGLLFYMFHEKKKKLKSHNDKKWVIDIVKHRWCSQMCHPLHIAGTFILVNFSSNNDLLLIFNSFVAFFLNLKLQFNPNIVIENMHIAVVMNVFDTLHPELDEATLRKEVLCIFGHV